MAKRKSKNSTTHWRLMDLHLHTPASGDYQEPEVTYLDILRRSEARGLDIIAFTDHNTVAGYRQMMDEIQQLEMLESLNRLTEDERSRLDEYRRLLEKVTVFPGFEFTATLGFHILGIFPPEKSVREVEHLLLSLNIPSEALDDGSMTVGATADVLTAYRLINEAGGLVIAAHANSTHGVAMRGFGFGGQTKIAYTQDPRLHAIEVTDLGLQGRRTTAAFFNGTKPEYPRRMHCIQGSDTHRLRTDPKNKKNLGIGDRATLVMLPEVSFQALKELFISNDFARTRPHWPATDEHFDFIQRAREDGPSINQDFHESMTARGGRLYKIIADVCAFANSNGGTLYIGVPAEAKKEPVGVVKAKASVTQLQRELSKRISPALDVQVDTMETRGKTVIRLRIPQGDDPPYAVNDNKVYVRDEAETGLAVRDEIVNLVHRVPRVKPEVPEKLEVTEEPLAGIQHPRTGVEIVGSEERNGIQYYTMRDLRNGNVVKNVTQTSARRLWHYAISEFRKLPEDLKGAEVSWRGDLGVLKQQKRGTRMRYDLVQKTAQGHRVYFGVTEDGIHGDWKTLVEPEGG
ncbi:MAG TPA: RNA-binding domain-containing protein [Anaerolineales bacterium]|nr:RNA-binding domain-containing protein [Anaerolineales bacterium]